MTEIMDTIEAQQREWTEEVQRREHAGGLPSGYYEGDEDERVPIGVTMPTIPGFAPDPADPLKPMFAFSSRLLAELSQWLVEGFSHEESVCGQRKVFHMQYARSCVCKVLLLHLVLRPEFFGKHPTLESVAGFAGKITKQSLGRVAMDFADRFPLFSRAGQSRPEVRTILAEAQLAARQRDPANEENMTLDFD